MINLITNCAKVMVFLALGLTLTMAKADEKLGQLDKKYAVETQYNALKIPVDQEHAYVCKLTLQQATPLTTYIEPTGGCSPNHYNHSVTLNFKDKNKPRAIEIPLAETSLLGTKGIPYLRIYSDIAGLETVICSEKKIPARGLPKRPNHL